MPALIDPAWEYFEPDPEVAEALGEAPGRPGTFDAVFDWRQHDAGTLGLRFGRGDPDRAPLRLAPAKPRGQRAEVRARECPACGGGFLPDRASRRNCSRACKPSPGRPRELPDAACACCGVTFRKRYARRRYCSRACHNEAQRQRARVAPPPAAPDGVPACRRCAGPVPPSRSPNPVPKLYCSRRCKCNAANAALQRRRREQREDSPRED